MADIHPKLLDFRNYLILVWRHLQLPDPTPVQLDIAHWLQHGGDRLGVEAFRGVGKSWLTAALASHELLLDPSDTKVLVSSANAQRAKNFTVFLRQLIEEMPLLQHLRPRAGQRDSVESFDVGGASNAQAPSVMAVGITGQLTGARASLIIADDIEIPKNSDTVAKRELLAEAVKEFDAVLAPGGKIKYLGTPQTEESIYNSVLIPRGYRFRVWPSRVPTRDKAEKYGGLLAPMIQRMVDQGVPPGTPTEPSRFTDEELTKRELSYGRSGFALQFQLDTSLSDAERYPLKTSDFVVHSCQGELGPVKVVWASGKEQIDNTLPLVGFSGDKWYRPAWTSRDYTEFHGAVMSIDPSGRGGDELGYAVVKMLNGNLFLAECKGLKGGYKAENLEALAHAARRNKAKKIIIEENFGGGMFTALFAPILKRIYDCSVEEVRHNRQKELRIIDTLEPVLNQHRLVVDPKVIEEDFKNYNEHPEETAANYRLFHQLTRITKDKGSLVHDDRLDALAMAVAYWVEQMAKDDHGAMAEHKARLFDEELERYYRDLGKPNGLLEDSMWSDTGIDKW